MDIPNSKLQSRKIPVLTMDKVNQLRSVDDIPAIIARRSERRFIETLAVEETSKDHTE